MISIYQLKPRFQALLRPMVRALAEAGVTANAVTVLAMLVSLALGALLFVAGPQRPALFLLLPLWMFLRMAFNAVDGMLAREFGQQSALGAVSQRADRRRLRCRPVPALCAGGPVWLGQRGRSDLPCRRCRR